MDCVAQTGIRPFTVRHIQNFHRILAGIWGLLQVRKPNLKPARFFLGLSSVFKELFCQHSQVCVPLPCRKSSDQMYLVVAYSRLLTKVHASYSVS